MRTETKFLLGGLGALVPLVASMAFGDADTLARYVQSLSAGNGALYRLLGYAFRVLALFLIGGLWACMHKAEQEPFKLIQLGIVAPAMITGMINASNLNRSDKPVNGEARASYSFITEAAADDGAKRLPPKKASKTAPSEPTKPRPAEEFIKGMLGR